MRNGKLTCVIFVRDVNSKGHEVSGYIDYAHRLRSTNFEPYFERRKKVRHEEGTTRPSAVVLRYVRLTECGRYTEISVSCFESRSWKWTCDGWADS